jgi:hypothetical protein
MKTDDPAMMEQETFCSYHPGRPTGLRCNRCGRPICSQCAVRIPVGYRCKTCVRDQQKIFDTATWYDFPAAFFAAAVVCGLGSILSSFIGFFILFVAGFAGMLAARAVIWAVRHRRNRYLWIVAAAGGIAGSLPIMIPTLAVVLFSLGSFGVEGLVALGMSLLWPLGYLIVAVAFLIANLKGIRLG